MSDDRAVATLRIVYKNLFDVTDPVARLAAAAEQNVKIQLANLKTHPTVSAAGGRRTAQRHGWGDRFDTGELSDHQSDRGSFVSIDTG